MQKISAVNGSVSFTYDTRLWYFLQPEHVGKIRQDYCIGSCSRPAQTVTAFADAAPIKLTATGHKTCGCPYSRSCSTHCPFLLKPFSTFMPWSYFHPLLTKLSQTSLHLLHHLGVLLKFCFLLIDLRLRCLAYELLVCKHSVYTGKLFCEALLFLL